MSRTFRVRRVCRVVFLVAAPWVSVLPVSAQSPPPQSPPPQTEPVRLEVVRRAKPREAPRRSDASILAGPESVRRRLLAQIERASSDAPLHFLHLGDSHSANGYFAIELATSVAGGRRVAPSFTVPFTRGLGLIKQTFSPEWRRSTWLQPIEGGLTSPGGTSALTRSPQAVARFTLPAGLPASRLTIWWSAPTDARFRLRLDDAVTVLLATQPLEPGTLLSRATIGIPAGVRQIVLDDVHVPPGGDLRLHGFSIDQREAAVTYDVLAVGGATHIHARDRHGGTLGPLLAERNPDVVLIWFGTNSVMGLSSQHERFLRDYAALVDTVRRRLPEATVILMGPPDLARRPSGCGTSGSTESGGSCQPVSHPNVPVIRDLIRRVATERGLLFFDVYRLYGESGGMVRSYHAAPPLANRDLVHLTEAGYRDVARQLRAALLRSDAREW